MKAKAVITKLDGRLVSAYFLDGHCVRINAPDPDSPAGCFYVGRIERIVPQLDCCFIEFQKGERGYYSLKDNRYAFWPEYPGQTHTPKGGDRIVVQVKRPAIAPKEALLTSGLSLTGYFLVLVVGDGAVHFSKKLKTAQQDPDLKASLAALLANAARDPSLPDFGFIVRTSTAGAAPGAVLSEAERLMRAMNRILQSARTAGPCTKVGEGPGELISEICQLHSDTVPEVTTDLPEIYETLKCFFAEGQVDVKLYDDPSYPLYKLYSLKTNRDRALARIVHMKSGANLYIDRTEALTAIDVNAAVSSSSGPAFSEKKKLSVNLEAAEEVARQLRMRNLSGMILVDFINMKSEENNKLLLKNLRQAVKDDPVPVQVLDMTRLGLVEITRKKEGRNVYEAFAEKPVL